jgi:acetylornithine deacetylase/succinyl-diaminopimelate desuccinylase-like protein
MSGYLDVGDFGFVETNMPASVDKALAHAEQHLPETLEALKELARIPSISANPPPDPEVQRSATAVKAWMDRLGLENTAILELEGVHPYVYGEHLHAPGAPTVLLYAHHDVQPIGRESHWKSPPFEPTERDGRLYGRGVVDDKAGAAIHFAALEAYLRNGGLPINVKMIVEGEEEIGSEHLAQFLEHHQERLSADVIVLTDTANLASGIPSITYALRGIVIVDVEVEAIDHPLHSGMWGGPVADAPLAMSKLLARLVDDSGKIAIDGFYDDVKPLDAELRDKIRALPYDEAVFRADAGVLDGVALAGEAGYLPYEQVWHRPSLSISALEAAPLAGASNQIVASARARIGVRVVPDMDPRKTAERLCRALESDPPWNVRVTTSVKAVAGPWLTEPRGPAFEAAERALERGFDKKAIYIGCGGSIPFVEPFARVLGGVPALLIGLEDPICNAHSENESLLLSDFVKALKSAIYLYEELAHLPR